MPLLSKVFEPAPYIPILALDFKLTLDWNSGLSQNAKQTSMVMVA